MLAIILSRLNGWFYCSVHSFRKECSVILYRNTRLLIGSCPRAPTTLHIYLVSNSVIVHDGLASYMYFVVNVCNVSSLVVQYGTVHYPLSDSPTGTPYTVSCNPGAVPENATSLTGTIHCGSHNGWENRPVCHSMYIHRGRC